MYLPNSLFSALVEVVLLRAIGTVFLVVGVIGLVAASRQLRYAPEPSAAGGTIGLARSGSISVPLVVALLVGLVCVLGGVELWMR